MSSPHRTRSVDVVATRRMHRITWILCGGALVLALAGGGAWHSLKRLRASQLLDALDAARSHMKAGDMPETARLLGAAQRAAPQDPAVIRATADFLIHANASPVEIAQTLRRVTDQPDATPEDLLKLARAEARQGSLETARSTLQRLPEAARSSAGVLELEASMLKLEGRDQEAEERLRTALLAAPESRESLFRLAVLDYKQPLSAIHQRGRQNLWRIAAGQDKHAVLAMQLLTKDSNLTGPEAARLVELAQAHPEAGQARLAALAVLMRLIPQDRPAIIERESRRAAAATGQERQELNRWLSSVDEHQRVLQMLPTQAQVKAKDLPADQLELRLESLAAAGRWDDVAALLTRDVEKPLGPASFNRWHAVLAARQNNDNTSVLRHLDLAFEASGRGAQAAAAVRTAETALQLKLPDLAASYYEEIAHEHKAATGLAVAMLEKALSLHAVVRSTSSMLRVACRIAHLSPDNRPAVFRADYLSLLAGESIEIIAHKFGAAATASKTETETETEAAQRLLLKALSAHRLRQPIAESETQALKKLKSLTWPPGQRAVLAAMIASSGDAATAFAIAERIAGTLLLPEETKLLALAR